VFLFLSKNMETTEQKSSMASAYDPKEVEHKIYSAWLDSGYFNPDNLPPLENGEKRSKPYSIMIAPPNVTGSLHMGHTLENTLSDILIRYHRMLGYKTLWVPGTDHGGISTNTVVEKDLKKQNISRHELGREKFIEKVWEWRNKYGDVILDQLKKLGFSLDWSRTAFTMDEGYQEAVKTAFEKYREQGLIYQGERLINWCVKDQTALSDLELEYNEEKSKLWYFKYPIKESDQFVTVATTRPETMLGDTSVAVNPKDARYTNLIGKTIILPITNREIPIIEDPFVEMEFGTGAVKVTPAHDWTDNDIAQRHNLPYIKVINEVGKIINVSEDFDGLKIAEAREKVIAKITELALLEKEEEITHNVAKCYRCNSTVEPILSKQWFLKVKPLAEKAIAAIESKRVQYAPTKWAEIALERLRNERDWCISRQIWWGHPIPIEDSGDTFDTWFSSALWPFAALGWPKQTSDLAQYYPSSVITSARDILHIWISKMIFSGLEFMDEIPFQTVLIHATVLAKDGRRMSKSLANGINPLDLIEKYGADATRFGLVYQAMGGQDIHFNEDVLSMGKKFANKLWNITRYVTIQNGNLSDKTKEKAKSELSDFFSALNEENNKAIFAKLVEIKKSTAEQIEKYEFGKAAHDLYDFIWKDYADVYIEQSKLSDSQETKDALYVSLLEILKMLHPFMPFITEELWKNLEQEQMLIVTKW
jgi:valyl-tRNA synthetase